MKRLILLPAVVVALAFATSAAAIVRTTDGGSSAPAGVDVASAIVQLKGDPVSIYSKTKPAQGKKIDFDSATVKSYRAKLAAERNDFKQWLHANAPSAKVTGQFDISVNAVAVQLNGTSLQTLGQAPQAQAVSYEAYYRPAADDPDLGLIHAIDAWGGPSGAPNAGKGVVVGVVDTGIDIKNPCFADSNPANDGAYTNDKVLSAAVFYNKAKQQGLTAAPVQEHGTHVAGTIACNFGTPASVLGATIPYAISGVAPAAKLRSYNIFPGQVLDSRSEDILNALDAAAADGVDVINMSLGGNAHGVQDLLTNAVNDLDQAGIVVAVAAGNSGPGHYTVESPGSAEDALTAGASSVGHFVASAVMSGGDSYPADSGEFPTVSSDLTAPLAAVKEGTVISATGLSDACSALAGDLSGKIALVSRGNCTFSQKMANARDAGALAVLIVNNQPAAVTMAQTAGFEPVIPTYLLSTADGTDLAANHDGDSTTIPATASYFRQGPDDQMAGFSSQGPTDVDFRIKPDVVAPGVNVLSSIPVSFCGGAPCFAFFQGTSMATPHLAGSAAFLKSQHPAWSADDIRSAIVNTADQNVLTKAPGSTGLENDVNVIGAGRENLLSATNAAVGLDPVSVSFGSVPSGSGQSLVRSVALTTLDAGSSNYTATVTGQTSGGVAFGASVSGGVVTVTMNEDKGASAGDYQGILRIYRGTAEVAHAAVYVFLKQGHK